MNVHVPQGEQNVTEQQSAQQSRPVRRPPGRVAKTIWFLIVLVLVAGLLVVVVGGDIMKTKGMNQFFASMKPPPSAVAVATAKRETIPRSLAAIGSFAAIRQVTVSPEVGGRIERIHFEAGTAVRAGDPLVQLNDQPERADLNNFRAQLNLAQANLSRTQALVNREFAAKATLDQNRAGLDQANAGIARVQALIAQKLVKAPFDGDLGVRQVNVGQYLQPGNAIVTLTDLSRLFLDFTVPEQNRSRVQIGQKVTATVDAFPGRTFEGRITTIEPQVNPDTRTIKLQATFDNPDKSLLPGMFANVAVLMPPQEGALIVPETAVDYSIYGDSVWVVRDKGKDEKGNDQLVAERVTVRVGDRLANRAVILEGIKEGDRVVSAGQLRLNTGAPVTISPVGPPTTPDTLPRN